MDIFDTYAVDETKEQDGVLVEIDDAKFLIARAGNPKYVKLLSKLFEKNRILLERKDKAADDLSNKLMIEVMAETILLGWEGNVKYKGQAMTYSVENAKTMLAHKDFRVQIGKLSEDFNAYKVKQDEDQEKN